MSRYINDDVTSRRVVVLSIVAILVAIVCFVAANLDAVLCGIVALLGIMVSVAALSEVSKLTKTADRATIINLPMAALIANGGLGIIGSIVPMFNTHSLMFDTFLAILLAVTMAGVLLLVHNSVVNHD